MLLSFENWPGPNLIEKVPSDFGLDFTTGGGTITGGLSFLVLVFASSFIITQIFVDDIQSKRTIRIEALLQNGAMGFVVGALIFSEIQYLVPITIYALLQYCFLLFYLGNTEEWWDKIFQSSLLFTKTNENLASIYYHLLQNYKDQRQ